VGRRRRDELEPRRRGGTVLIRTTLSGPLDHPRNRVSRCGATSGPGGPGGPGVRSGGGAGRAPACLSPFSLNSIKGWSRWSRWSSDGKSTSYVGPPLDQADHPSAPLRAQEGAANPANRALPSSKKARGPEPRPAAHPPRPGSSGSPPLRASGPFRTPPAPWPALRPAGRQAGPTAAPTASPRPEPKRRYFADAASAPAGSPRCRPRAQYSPVHAPTRTEPLRGTVPPPSRAAGWTGPTHRAPSRPQGSERTAAREGTGPHIPTPCVFGKGPEGAGAASGPSRGGFRVG
jgi:hypothetical protein